MSHSHVIIKVKVTKWVQQPIDSQYSHIPFVPCHSALPLLGYGYFQMWPWKSKVKILAKSNTVGSTSYRLTSLPFHVNWPSYSWDTLFFLLKSYLEIQGQGHGWGQSHKVGLTSYWLTSLAFHVNQSPTPGIQHFQNLILKIQNHGHNSRSHSGSDFLSTHIPFIPCQSVLPFLEYGFYKMWLWKSKVKDTSSRSYSRSNILSTHITFVPSYATLPFLKYSLLKIWPWKFKSRSWERLKFQATMGVPLPVDSHPFRSMLIGPPIPVL